MPQIAGKPPTARYGHSMNYYPDRNIIVVFGGRNDDNFYEYGQSYMNDVWILYLERLTWCRWNAKCNYVPVSRYSHCGEVTGHTLMLFGGLCEENYCKAEVSALDLDGPKRLAFEDEENEEDNEENNEDKDKSDDKKKKNGKNKEDDKKKENTKSKEPNKNKKDDKNKEDTKEKKNNKKNEDKTSVSKMKLKDKNGKKKENEYKLNFSKIEKNNIKSSDVMYSDMAGGNYN